MDNRVKRIIRCIGIIVFGIYICVLIYCLFFSEKYGRFSEAGQIYRYNLIPFMEIRRFWKYREQLGIFISAANILGNIIGFLPLGSILPIITKKMNSLIMITLSGFGLSFTVEIIQLITKVGCFDVDDIILNTLGTVTGYILFKVCDIFRRIYYGKKI